MICSSVIMSAFPFLSGSVYKFITMPASNDTYMNCDIQMQPIGDYLFEFAASWIIDCSVRAGVRVMFVYH